MPPFASEPRDQHASRLVLRPVQSRGPADGEQEWELTDPWGGDERASAALAVTRRVANLVMLVGVTVDSGAPVGTVSQLVQQLIAVLRRTDASMVCSSVTDKAVRQELLAAGFVPVPDQLDAATPWVPADARRVILQL